MLELLVRLELMKPKLQKKVFAVFGGDKMSGGTNYHIMIIVLLGFLLFTGPFTFYGSWAILIPTGIPLLILAAVAVMSIFTVLLAPLGFLLL